ncbi:DUF6382 domain-containing protein [Alkaliphilus peptidifermentans]|uniref:Forkhead associated (FHA) domain, binds pSer, pThr, pTyr n=1 Tax=Alkaliphilus peptidifermentans DSM 18978 TaxID=1120976 RepID=A0A1G5J963_9FIRM|nr:DUF6382 domain-containing protein [Alkaliphilus peptidifermentans]SCY84369.1 Forkhead associated (FHA) domain, binds pSer, pThr, pTyr [Alkaliphilus peptidifermentans DSM 18978]
MTIIKEKFQINYETNSNGSYLVLKMLAAEKVIRHQIEILSSNEYSKILPVNLNQKDGSLYIFYNITSRQKLSQILERRKLKKLEFIDILIGICRTVTQSSNYLLFYSNFLIHEEYIYVNPSDLDISLVYMPFEVDKESFNSDFIKLVNKLIIHIDTKDDINDDFIQQVLIQLSSENFNFSTFLKHLKETRLSDANKINPPLNKILHQENILKLQEKKYKEKFSSEAPHNILNDKAEAIGKVLFKNKTKKENGLSLKNKLMAIIVQVLLISSIALLLLESNIILNEEGLFDFTALMGSLIVAGVIDYLVMKKIIFADNIITEKRISLNNDKKANEVEVDYKEKNNFKNRIEKLHPININKQEISNCSEFSNLSKKALTNKNADNNLDTMIISIEEEKEAFLECVKDGLAEKTVIDTKKFIVGKLIDHVDFVISSRAVSRIHAEIFFREDEYYLLDLNSKNGTFVNGKQISSNKPYKINDNDTINFADREYRFTRAF